MLLRETNNYLQKYQHNKIFLIKKRLLNETSDSVVLSKNLMTNKNRF